jgi:glucose/mannose-6-phosphate isomerase
MNLDDPLSFQLLDSEDMLSHIDGLPDQLRYAWNMGKQQPLPVFDGLQTILVAGMGGSAIGADLVAAYAAPLCPIPIIVHRDYGLPEWAKGPHVLVILSSHSGNTEETLSVFEKARLNGCMILAITTGGKLGSAARFAGFPVWIFEHQGQPRTAVGFSFGLLLAALFRLGLVPNPEVEILQTVEMLREQQAVLGAASLIEKNPAKRLAGQLYDRMVVVIGSGYLAPVARRWKDQISEVAKAWGQFEILPELDHNSLAGLSYPADILSHTFAVFLRSTLDHPRNQLRSEFTRKAFLIEGINVDFVDARGNGAISHIWSTVLLGDYLTYYLAMMYSVDPTRIPIIESFKKEMLKSGE